ncbi:MAG TPA: 2-phospho-L-lactate transferase, partial [Bacillota bacterium]
AYGVAQCYQGLLDGMVIDQQDRHLADRVRQLGITVEVADTMLDEPERRRRVARTVLALAARLRGGEGAG